MLIYSFIAERELAAFKAEGKTDAQIEAIEQTRMIVEGEFPEEICGDYEQEIWLMEQDQRCGE